MIEAPPPILWLHARTVLVSADTVRAALGNDAEAIEAKRDDGTIRWVWNIAVSNGPASPRELRYWARELIAPEFCWRLTVRQAIDCVIGTNRNTLRSPEVSQMLLASRAHVMRLVDTGQLSGRMAGHTQLIARASLDAFLTRRLVF